MSGEIVDLSCYLSKGSKGKRHKTCAEMCAKKGLPIGVITEAGDVYLLIEDHDNPDPYDARRGSPAARPRSAARSSRARHAVDPGAGSRRVSERFGSNPPPPSAAVNRFLPTALLVVGAAVTIGCAGDGPPTTGATSTFDIIQEQIFNPNCLSGGCHNAQSRAGNMNLSPGASYDEIVGQLADNPAAHADGLLRVEPFDPDNSFLMIKLTDPSPRKAGGCRSTSRRCRRRTSS